MSSQLWHETDPIPPLVRITRKGKNDQILGSVIQRHLAQQKYPGGWKTPKPYLRIVPQPK